MMSSTLNHGKMFIIGVDISKVGVSTILMQDSQQHEEVKNGPEKSSLLPTSDSDRAHTTRDFIRGQPSLQKKIVYELCITWNPSPKSSISFSDDACSSRSHTISYSHHEPYSLLHRRRPPPLPLSSPASPPERMVLPLLCHRRSPQPMGKAFLPYCSLSPPLPLARVCTPPAPSMSSYYNSSHRLLSLLAVELGRCRFAANSCPLLCSPYVVVQIF
ncbi:hypothetical protein B296_00000826 [Ensete ventricosum]|uniref:Uncharacterized protein n=1 Tax=Ensete ventricosum TaxID=4639 RepID=A0A427ATD2_ENSVE|nr:hypothetical protein B296_00000826 [Ensete ventricosum]